MMPSTEATIRAVLSFLATLHHFPSEFILEKISPRIKKRMVSRSPCVVHFGSRRVARRERAAGARTL
jgi:hypothetical protein